MKFYDVEQNTEEWENLRIGLITSSSLSKIMANYGKAFGEPAKKYAVQLAVEQLTGQSSSDNYTNSHMQRGHEQEPLAVHAYESENFCQVLNGGFFQCGDMGCSPDGLVDDDGLIEVKSHIPHIHYDNIRRGSFNPQYRWQYAGNLKITGSNWIDTISYCDNFPENKKLCVYRLTKEDLHEEFKQIDIRVDEFRQLISKIKSDIS